MCEIGATKRQQDSRRPRQKLSKSLVPRVDLSTHPIRQLLRLCNQIFWRVTIEAHANLNQVQRHAEVIRTVHGAAGCDPGLNFLKRFLGFGPLASLNIVVAEIIEQFINAFAPVARELFPTYDQRANLRLHATRIAEYVLHGNEIALVVERGLDIVFRRRRINLRVFAQQLQCFLPASCTRIRGCEITFSIGYPPVSLWHGVAKLPIRVNDVPELLLRLGDAIGAGEDVGVAQSRFDPLGRGR